MTYLFIIDPFVGTGLVTFTSTHPPTKELITHLERRLFMARVCWCKGMAKRIAAYLCLAVGVAGLALPVLPGIPLLAVGVALLPPEHLIRRKLARWIPRTGKRS